MKKFLIFLMFLLSLTSLAERFVVVSKDGYANLREKGTTKSKVKTKIDNSYRIVNMNEYNGDYDDWYYVEVEKNGFFEWGYIHKSQLAMHPETYVISSKDDYANLRSKPSKSSKVLVKLDNNIHVTRYPKKTVGDWYYVEWVTDYNDGGERFLNGYIHKSQLKKLKK